MRNLYVLFFLFTTLSYGQNCATVTTDESIPITSTNVAMPTVDVTEDVSITDINITINLTHSFLGDLSISLQSPMGTSVPIILPNNCGGANIMDATFDDDGEALECGDGISPGTYQPDGMLSLFNGENSAGTWTLVIADTVPLDDGNFNSFTLEFCTDEVLSTNDTLVSNFNMLPNPANSLVHIDLMTDSSGLLNIFNILGEKVLSRDVSGSSSIIDVSSMANGVYLVQLIDDSGKKSIKKLIKK